MTSVFFFQVEAIRDYDEAFGDLNFVQWRLLGSISRAQPGSGSNDGSSQKAKQKRLISVISLFSRLSRPKEAALGFVGTALCVCFISGVFP